MRFFATPPIDGAFAEYVAVHAAFAHPVPDTISDDAAALLEPLSVGIWACRKAGVTTGSRVLVTGAGPIGVLAGLVARASGATHVAVTDINPARLEQAVELGIDQAVLAGTDLADIGADVLLECTGIEAVAGAGIAALRPAGTAVLVGMGANASMTLPVQAIQNRELTVTRDVPLRQHLPGRDRAGRLRPGAAGRPGRRPGAAGTGRGRAADGPDRSDGAQDGGRGPRLRPSESSAPLPSGHGRGERTDHPVGRAGRPGVGCRLRRPVRPAGRYRQRRARRS
jgi:hypothetical protein